MPEETNIFDEAWDEANDNVKKKPESQEVKQEEKIDQPQSTEENKTNQRPEDESHLANGDESKAPTEDETIDYKTLYEKEKQRSSSWEGRIRAANRKADEAEAKVARMQQEIQELKDQTAGRQDDPPQSDPVDTDDPDLKEFLDEFPALHAPLQALIRKEAKALIGSEMKTIKPQMQKIEEDTEARKAREKQAAQEAHFAAIQTAHPYYESWVSEGKLDDWISSQPVVLQDTYNRIKNGGTATEAIEMFDLMAKDLKLTSPQPTNETNGDKQEKLKSMVAVPNSSGGPPPDGPDKNDFDAAWDEADD